MTDAAAPARPPESEFLEIWSASFAQVMGQITGSAMPCSVRAEAPPDLTPAGEGDFWAAVTSSGAFRGEMVLRMAGATVLRLAQMFMSEPPTPEAATTAEHREAVVELLRQISGVVAGGAKARWGEIQLLVEAAPAAPSWTAAGTYWLQVGDEGPSGMGVEAGVSAALAAELKAEKAQAAKTETAAPAIASGVAAAPPSPAGSEAAAENGAMGLLMDVPLAMTLHFGGKKLLLREVLELTAGSVVELDRKIQEPVDLLLDGRLVARGEVVVIDGNYGLRVTDVSPLGMS